jgi:hypothetical protein
MRYLFGLLTILLIFAIGSSQTLFPVLNQTSLIYKQVLLATDSGDSTDWISIRGASDVRIMWTSEDSIDAVIKYQLRNSYTGMTTAAATIDSAVTTKANGSKGFGTLIALTTLLGYDEIRYELSQSGDAHGGTTAGKYLRIYIYPVAKSGGFCGDIEGRRPVYNKATKFYEKLDFDGAAATDTTNWFSLNGVTDVKTFVTSNDSLIEVLGYILNNSIIDSTTAVTNQTTVTFDAHTTTVTDSCLSPGNVLLATLAGWNRIKFVSNPTSSGSRTPSAETGKRYRIYYYFQRRVE